MMDRKLLQRLRDLSGAPYTLISHAIQKADGDPQKARQLLASTLAETHPPRGTGATYYASQCQVCKATSFASCGCSLIGKDQSVKG